MKWSGDILLLMIGIFFPAMGVFLGFDWKLRPAIHLGIDARLGGENSGTFSVRYQS